ncbi:DUF2184 domain-containing protein [Rhodovarius crocodyli]|uniref:DUF2184 domain-containing protein n=1 Tax=Rhodovarius crocodyli TaxID=1979269 RepID=A0A437MC96_9PROT|nr:major capsid family protein [Rhodovarius crocodyli]RVT95245.1 DUF2184 domain-containing protein [Rhodovarius crocodyli]
MRNADFAALESQWGIFMPEAREYLPDAYRHNFALAMDAQPTLVTTANSAIPAYLTQWVDPEIVKVIVAPMKAAEIMGEVRKGTWLDTTALFPVVENTGEVSSYGDYNNNGHVGVNANWPQRQSYLYQTITEWGELELERADLARLNWASQQNLASVQVLNKFQNKTYFFGVAGLQNYGILNDPSLSAALQPGPKAYGSQAHGPWVTAGVVTATANEIYSDIQSLYIQLVAQQAQGAIDMATPMKLCMSPGSSIAMTATNSFNVNVADLLKKNFPNLRIETAPEYATAAGNVVQLIADQVQGQDTGYCAFNEKLRAHPVIREMSAFKQKKTQGTWGAIIKQPFAIAQMLGL